MNDAQHVFGRGLAVLAAAMLAMAGFLPWAANGRVGVDQGLATWGPGSGQPTVALTLVFVAALIAVPALVDDRGWPRALGAVAAGLLVIGWLVRGPDGALSAGVVLAIVGVGCAVFAAAVATGAPTGTTWRDRRRAAAAAKAARKAVPPPPPMPTWAGAPAPTPRPAPIMAPPPLAPVVPVRPAQGAKPVPFTDVLTFDAWGPSRAAATAAALRALVSAFARPTPDAAMQELPVRLRSGDNVQLVEQFLAMAIDAITSEGLLAVDAELSDAEDALTGVARVVNREAAQLFTAVPRVVEVVWVRPVEPGAAGAATGEWQVRFRLPA